MGLLNFWQNKAEKKTLEQLVNEFSELRKEFASYRNDKEGELAKAREEAAEAKKQLILEREKLRTEEANKNVIIHFYPGKELFVVIEGDMIYSDNISQERYEELVRLRNEKDIPAIKKLLLPGFKDPITQKEEKIDQVLKSIETDEGSNALLEKEIEETIDGVRALTANGDFVLSGDTVRMTGINRSIPKVLLDRFLELYLNDDTEEYEALKNFWRWIVTNPNPIATEQFYNLISMYHVPISKEGIILAYRWVKSVDKKPVNKQLVEFISNQWAKVKRNKKSPKNFWVVEGDHGSFSLSKNEKPDDIVKVHGNLNELYSNLKNLQTEQSYTDGYTRTFDIRIGKPVKMNRKDCDESGASCSKGLHACFDLKDYAGNGDVKLLIAINPRDIVSVPYRETKFRCCEYLPLAVLEKNEDSVEFLKKGEGLDMLEDYFELKVEELRNMAENSTVKELKVQKLLPDIRPDLSENEVTKEINTIVNSFQSQIGLDNRIQYI